MTESKHAADEDLQDDEKAEDAKPTPGPAPKPAPAPPSENNEESESSEEVVEEPQVDEEPKGAPGDISGTILPGEKGYSHPGDYSHLTGRTERN